MKNTKVIVAIAVSIGMLTGSLMSATSVQNSWRLDAAKTECAQFNPTHGQFEWLEIAK
jgi:hypothetical protein